MDRMLGYTMGYTMVLVLIHVIHRQSRKLAVYVACMVSMLHFAAAGQKWCVGHGILVRRKTASAVQVKKVLQLV